MNIIEARAAIEEILASIPDEEMPPFDRVEERDDTVVVWWGSHGYHLGSAKVKGKREPLMHRRNGAWDAIEQEMVYRADRRLLDNGDNPTGITLARKAVRPS